MLTYPAHIRTNLEQDDNSTEFQIQSVEEHCRSTAQYASSALKDISFEYCAYLSGLLHDMGKFSEKFANYIIDAAKGKPVKVGSVNHTFAGVHWILEQYHNSQFPMNLTAELIAIAIGSHHGLFDCFDQQSNNGFKHRMLSHTDIYNEAAPLFLDKCESKENLNKLFEKANQEVNTFLYNFKEFIKGDEKELRFHLAFLARLISSAVIDGDRKDTATFMCNTLFPIKKDKQERLLLWDTVFNHVEEKLNQLPCETPIQKARRIISDRCLKSSYLSNNLYRLNVPTGGGKTLSSLRYAVSLAKQVGKERIIFTSPLISILEQNASVLREFVGNEDIILEHHSNLVEEETENENEKSMRKLLVETWESPIIITTLVQLLNTLFSSKTSSVRRFHSLCNSIIVIDEVQTVPLNMLSLFTTAINFLTTYCNTTVVLCSATQPCIEKIKHPIKPIPNELISCSDLLDVFKRTEIKDKGNLTINEITNLAKQNLKEIDSLLIVCNLKSEAQLLYQNLYNSDAVCFHLSAGMCPEHRREIISEIKEHLANKKSKKVICISTQIIEAGVDISFSRVMRFSAGMDNIIQTAGRCNRNNESNILGEVQIVNCIEEKNLPKEIQASKDATLSLLVEYKEHPEYFNNSLDSDIAINWYYQKLYQNKPTDFSEYPIGSHGTIYDLLTQNLKYCYGTIGTGYLYRQAFKLAGDKFQVFDQNTTDVLVSYKNGKNIIAELKNSCTNNNFYKIKSLLNKAKSFTISLYENQLNLLKNLGEICAITDNYGNVITHYLIGHYDEKIGFMLDNKQIELLEV